MIFRSRRRRNASTEDAVARTDLDATQDDAPDEASHDDVSRDDASQAAGATSDATARDTGSDPGSSDEAAQGEAGGSLAELDAQEWRDLGPYDISEVDADALEDPDPDEPRIDLGSIVLPAVDGMELRLQVDENSQQIVSAMMIRGDSALEVGAFAAPRSGGLWAEIRDELAAAAQSAGGSANLVPGPFGVELRRWLPVQTPDGQQGYQPSRMWVAEGPRWMLRGIVYGQAALEEGIETPVAEILEAFRQIVVRRGDEAMAPGDLLPLSIPDNITRQPGAADVSGPDSGE